MWVPRASNELEKKYLWTITHKSQVRELISNRSIDNCFIRQLTNIVIIVNSGYYQFLWTSIKLNHLLRT